MHNNTNILLQPHLDKSRFQTKVRKKDQGSLISSDTMRRRCIQQRILSVKPVQHCHKQASHFHKIFIGDKRNSKGRNTSETIALISHLTASILSLTRRTCFSWDVRELYRLPGTGRNTMRFLPRGLLSAASVAFLPSPQWLWSKGRHCSPVPATTSRLRDGSLGWPRFRTR